jgi:hypothetical protein
MRAPRKAGFAKETIVVLVASGFRPGALKIEEEFVRESGHLGRYFVLL